MEIFNIVYYVAIGACAVEGASKAVKKGFGIVDVIICSYLSALGGGLIRDIFILQTYPVALTNVCLPEIIISTVLALIYWDFCYYRKKIESVSKVFDIVGLSGFIVIGAEKTNYSISLSALSAAVTALCGGITSSVYSGENIKAVILSNKAYRIITVIGSLIYAICMKCGVETGDVQSILTVLISLSIFVTDSEIMTEIVSRLGTSVKAFQKKTSSNIPKSFLDVYLKALTGAGEPIYRLPEFNYVFPINSYVAMNNTIKVLHKIRMMKK